MVNLEKDQPLFVFWDICSGDQIFIFLESAGIIRAILFFTIQAVVSESADELGELFLVLRPDIRFDGVKKEQPVPDRNPEPIVGNGIRVSRFVIMISKRFCVGDGNIQGKKPESDIQILPAV